MFEINLNQLPFSVVANILNDHIGSLSWGQRMDNAAKTFHGSYIRVVGESPKLVFRDEACYNMFLLRWA